MTSTERFKNVDCKMTQELFNLFFEHGKFVPLLQKLCWTNKEKQSVKGSGLYCFTEVVNKNISISTFLYVGRTQTLHKRFNEHRNAWLNRYVLMNPSCQLHWGYVHEKDMPIDFGTVGEMENWCWRNTKKLGLIAGKELQRLARPIL